MRTLTQEEQDEQDIQEIMRLPDNGGHAWSMSLQSWAKIVPGLTNDGEIRALEHDIVQALRAGKRMLTRGILPEQLSEYKGAEIATDGPLKDVFAAGREHA